MRRLAVPLALLSVVGFVPGIGRDNPLIQVMSLISRHDVKQALNYPDANRAPILDEWVKLTEINAPSGKERERAESIRRSLEPLHLDKVYYDAKGNLIAIRKGLGQSRAVVIDAHLDTVFKEGLKIKAQVRDGKVFAPGIGDDTRNLEAVLASIRALDEAGIKTVADLIFVFTVEEETSMDGARQFIADNKDRIGSYVALDGGYEGLTYGGIGINWYKHHFIGPGGHTRSSTPPYSATLPLGRAISRIYQMELPKQHVVNLNIGMLGGSQVVNAKADDAWFTVDLRSTDQKAIDEYEVKIAKILREEAERAGMEVRTERLSKLPAAQVEGNRDSFTVRMAEAVHQALGFENPPLSSAGSNNSNVALLAGLPALSTGAAPCGDSHSLSEWCQIEPFYKGIKKVIMLEIALAGIADKE